MLLQQILQGDSITMLHLSLRCTYHCVAPHHHDAPKCVAPCCTHHHYVSFHHASLIMIVTITVLHLLLLHYVELFPALCCTQMHVAIPHHPVAAIPHHPAATIPSCCYYMSIITMLSHCCNILHHVASIMLLQYLLAAAICPS